MTVTAWLLWCVIPNCSWGLLEHVCVCPVLSLFPVHGNVKRAHTDVSFKILCNVSIGELTNSSADMQQIVWQVIVHYQQSTKLHRARLSTSEKIEWHCSFISYTCSLLLLCPLDEQHCGGQLHTCWRSQLHKMGESQWGCICLFSVSAKSPHVLKKKTNKQLLQSVFLSSSFSRRRGCWRDHGGQTTCNERGRSWFQVWRSAVWALQGRLRKSRKVQTLLSLVCILRFFLSIEAGEVAAVVAVFVLQIPCWRDWCGLEQEQFKRGRRETSLELQKRDGGSLDYKRGAALDQVISDSSDVGGKAAGLQPRWWLLRSPRFVGSPAGNHRAPLIERCCWRRGRQWGGEALHPTEIEQVVWH